ncbi:MAG: glycosyltransferase family 39 protein, partial [Anaerolineales bacterium]|nr:glycosyltransferase family 39 protein [Anaerolineales bacterium]
MPDQSVKPAEYPAGRSSSRGFTTALELVSIAGILILAAYLRLAFIGTNPGWYTDEGTLLDIARHLMNGDIRYLAVRDSILMFGRPPLFSYLLAGVSELFGYEIVTLRTITGILGTITVGMVFFVTRWIGGPDRRWLAVFSALIYAIYPSAVIYNRIGFSYNLIAPLMLIVTLGFWEYLKSSRSVWLAAAAITIGIGMSSDLMMFTFLIPLFVIVAAVRPKDLIWSLPLAILPFLITAAWMWGLGPEAYLFDLRFTAARLAEVPFFAQLPFLIVNFSALLQFDLWMG